MIKTPQKCKIMGLQKFELGVKVKGHQGKISTNFEQYSEWLETQK